MATISLEKLRKIAKKSILMKPVDINESPSSRKYDRLNITREKANILLRKFEICN